ncbi:MAG: hypothetical protein LIP05_09490 [Tannerellaceae bacterium]|nr:hypothetical protein [Tannerellaceae bacterium]
MKLLDLFLKDKKVYVKIKLYNSNEDLKAIPLSEFFQNVNSENKYDVEKYIEYSELLFNCINEKNKFNVWLNKNKIENQGKVPLHYTIWNLSFPFYNYIGTVIVESFTNTEPNSKIKDEDLNEIRNIFHAFKIEFQKSENELIKLRIRWEAIKAAKAAIMSRNMSHNLGSHVMAYLKQNLNSVQDLIENNALYNILPNHRLDRNKDPFRQEHIYELINSISNSETDVEIPFLVKLGKFISYLQERQDFIATIATDYIPYYSTVNVKDFIYDELNPDLRHERHDQERSGCKPDNILLNYIAYSEGLTRQNQLGGKSPHADIILKFRKFNGKSVTRGSNEERDLDAMRAYNLSLPGGVVGRQAIFSIVENVIRNAAKHGNWKSKGKLELTSDILEKADVSSLPNNDGLNGEKGLQDFLTAYYFNDTVIDSTDLYVITLTDNLHTSKESLNALKNAVKEYYVDENGVLKNSNKGIKEMRISAAWLRGLTDMERKDENLLLKVGEKDTAGNYQKLAPIFNVRISVDEEKNNRLQYIFCIQKTKNVALLVANDEHSLDEKLLMENDWDILTEEKYRAIQNKSYEVMVVPDDQMKKQISSYSPNRILVNQKIYKDCSLNREKREVNLDKKLLVLLKELFQIQDTDEITISDNKGIKEHYEKIIYGDGRALTSKYVYKRHHENYKEFANFMDTYAGSKDFLFIEGITGHNSTDRLVRNEQLNEKWFYKQIHAMNCRVAVFDERLFKKMTGVEEFELSEYIDGQIEEILNKNIDLESKKAELKNKLWNKLTLGLSEKECRNLSSDIILANDVNIIKAIFSKASGNKENIKTRNHFSIVNAQKNVYFFTVIFDECTKEFGVWGYTGYDQVKVKDKEKDNMTYVGVLNKIARIYMSAENKPVLTFTSISEDQKQVYECSFDYLTIHQGLLDKIYEKFGFKHIVKENGEEDNTNKYLTTFELYNSFLKKADINPEDYRSYLPQLIIHSGRSRPSHSDLPQKQPFIQYASIEHAVLDCKYSFVEFLDYARYEP